jgi:membrane protease YdiL (CAAX protease family)
MPTPDDRTKKLSTLKASIIVILLFETCALFARSFALLRLEDGGMSHQFAKDLSWLLVPVILGILMLPILRQNWHKLKMQFQLPRVTLRLVLVSVALGITLRLVRWGGIVTNASFQIFTLPSRESLVGPVFGFSCPAPSTLALLVLVSVIMTPLLEETINRGFILQSLLHRGRWTALVGSAILFGIFHRPQSIGPAIIIGVFFAIQFLNSKSLWASVISHGTYNALVIIDWHCIQTSWNPASVTSATKAVGMLSFVLMLVSLALAIILIQKRWYIPQSGRIAPR